MNQNNTNSSSLLTLLQLSDSALPLGGYSHSWGLETWVQVNELKSTESVADAIKSILLLSIAPQDGAACGLAHRYAVVRNFSSFYKLNEMLSAARWTKETLAGATSMGERLYKLCTEIGIVRNERERMPEAMHHSAVFGWVCALCSVSASEAVSGYLYSACSNLVSAAVRLVPLGQTDGQRILLEMRTAINLLVDVCLECDLDEIGGFAPLNEWASIEHETLYSRLFQS